MINYLIPPEPGLDTLAFGRLFDNTDTSYKFLWMIGVTRILEKSDFKQKVISFEQIIREMLTAGYYPCVQFRLSYGARDQIKMCLKEYETTGHLLEDESKMMRQIRKMRVSKDMLERLTVYVPYRTLSPFFVKELKDVKKLRKNRKIVELANASFDSANPPLYRFHDKKIEIHDHWCRYLEANLQLVKAWIEYNWIHFLQRRNLTIPAISRKTKKPEARGSLQAHGKIWGEILKQETRLRCIYSDQLLEEGSFSLDHYIPWKFVVHNEIWNLVPATKSANSKKSDKLPDRSYRRLFIDQQHICVRYIHANYHEKRQLLEQHKDSYEVSLGLGLEHLAKKEVLANAFDGVLDPMISLAKTQGFEPDWRYEK